MKKLMGILMGSFLLAGSANAMKIEQCRDELRGAEFYAAGIEQFGPILNEQRMNALACYYKYKNRGQIIGERFVVESLSHEFVPMNQHKWGGIPFHCGDNGRLKAKDCAVITVRFK